MGSHDLILKILDMLFGTWSSAFFSGTGDGNISLLAELLSGVNVLAMLFAAIITGLFAFGGTVNAAVNGSFFSEGWSGASSLVSVILALTMVMPVNLGMFSKESNYQGQVSGAQLLVLKLAVAGSDVADALYKKTVVFFTKQGDRSSTTIGHLTPVLDLVEANLCTLAAMDTWAAGATIETLKNESRHKTKNRPFKDLYAIRYGKGKATKVISYKSYKDFNTALSQINIAQEKEIIDDNGEMVKVKVYANEILFGGRDHICGVIAIPTIDLKQISPSPIAKNSSKVQQVNLVTDLVDIKSKINIQAYKEIRLSIVTLIQETHTNALNLLLKTLELGVKNKTAAQYYSENLNSTSEQDVKFISTIALPLVNKIYTSGANFFKSVSNQSIKMDKKSRDIITHLMLDKGWLHAGIWGLEMSRLGSILPELKSKVLELHITNKANNLCLSDSLVTSIFDTLKSWVGIEKSCESNIFLTTSWPALKRFTITSITDGNIDSKIGAEKYFLRSARIMNDNQCGIKGQESSACESSNASSVSYVNHLMVSYIWNDPEKYGLSNPQEPITYINSIGQRMLEAVGITQLIWIAADAAKNAVDKNAIGAFALLFSLIASALKPLVTGLLLLMGAFLSFGYLLSYVLPVLPVIHWIMGVLSWVITIVLAYIALPFALVITVSPNQGNLLQQKQKVIQIIVEVFLTPIILLFSFFVALAIAKLFLALFNEIFWQAIGMQSIRNSADSIGGAMSNLFEPFALLVIASSSMILIFRYSFSVMHTIPRRIFSILSISGQTFSEQYTDDPYSELSLHADTFSTSFSKQLGSKNQKKNKNE